MFATSASEKITKHHNISKNKMIEHQFNSQNLIHESHDHSFPRLLQHTHEQSYSYIHKLNHVQILIHYSNIQQKLNYHYHQSLYNLRKSHVFFMITSISTSWTLLSQSQDTTLISNIKDPKHACDDRITSQWLHIQI